MLAAVVLYAWRLAGHGGVCLCCLAAGRRRLVMAACYYVLDGSDVHVWFDVVYCPLFISAGFVWTYDACMCSCPIEVVSLLEINDGHANQLGNA